MFRTLISAEQLAGRLSEAGWRIVDCRFSLADTGAGRRAYAAGHIPGAVYAHLDEDLSGPVVPGQTGRHPLPDKEQFMARLSAWSIDEHTQVIAYDDNSGMVASRLWWLLHSLGHDRVAVLDGGFAAWTALPGAPITTEVPEPQPHTFRPRPPISHAVDAAQVNQLRLDPAWLLVDSREDFRYRGESEPIDPVAGHIPGAVNAFFMENLDEQGRFLPPGKLRERFLPLLAGRTAEMAVFYCGSGVSACHNVLAMAHAGLGEATLYPGSWSEWITDAERAVGRFPEMK